MGCCGGNCKKINSLIVLVSGLALADSAGMWVPGVSSRMALAVGGVLLAVYGLVKLVHAMGMCPECGKCCEAPMPSKRR